MHLDFRTVAMLLILGAGAALVPATARASFVINGILSSSGVVPEQPLSRVPGDSFDVTAGTARATASFDGTLGALTSANGFGDRADVTVGYSSSYNLAGTGATAPSNLIFNFGVAGNLTVSGEQLPDGGFASYKFQVGGSFVDTVAFSCQNLTGINFGRPVFNCSGDANSTNDTTVTLNIARTLLATLPDSGTLNMQLQTSASTLGEGSAAALANSITLISVTVPEDFTGDISGLSVIFDSGLTMPVTRASDSAAIPEPTALAILSGPMLLLPFLRRRASARRQPPRADR